VTFNGAFAEDQVYTLKTIKEVIAYAESLGIRVVPEFDNPGHTRAIGFDPYFKEIVRCFNQDWNSRV
jgi:hexosaminidase